MKMVCFCEKVHFRFLYPHPSPNNRILESVNGPKPDPQIFLLSINHIGLQQERRSIGPTIFISGNYLLPLPPD